MKLKFVFDNRKYAIRGKIVSLNVAWESVP
jgi:hypothetical protein